MRTIALLLLALPTLSAWACDACVKQQPEVLQGITHGTGPQSQWDMPIVWCSAIVVVVTLLLAVKFLVRPGEREPGHIKRSVVFNLGSSHE